MRKIICLVSLLALVYSATAQQPINPLPDANPQESVFTVVEQMPSFPGGNPAMMNYVSENIKYPKAAMEQGIEGNVMLRFVVDKTGQVRDITVLRDIGAGCGAEAKRVVSVMPKWLPGKQNGVAVNVYYTLPVRFRINTANPTPAGTSPNK